MCMFDAKVPNFRLDCLQMHDASHLALAALLHDVGKLYQRAHWNSAPEGLSDLSHPAYTAWAIRRHPQWPRSSFHREEP